MIGIIDSGLGGLSIAKAIWQELPRVSTIYLADHEYFPYGNKSASVINKRLIKIMDWLLKKNCQLIVIACNTITMATIKSLRQRYPLPFIGTEPAVKQGGVVLVTPATAKSRGYRELSRQYPVTTIPCPGLAEAIEAGADITNFLPPIPPLTKIIVLGCTHYILVKERIQKIVGRKIEIIEPSAAIARQTRAVLTKENLLNAKKRVKRLFFTTGPTKRLRGIIFTRCSL